MLSINWVYDGVGSLQCSVSSQAVRVEHDSGGLGATDGRAERLQREYGRINPAEARRCVRETERGRETT